MAERTLLTESRDGHRVEITTARALLVLLKPKFAVRLHTAGVEQNMLESSDEAWIARVAQALNRAIVGD